MDPFEEATVNSAVGAASFDNPASDAGVDSADGMTQKTHVQENVPAGVLSGIGPNAETAGQIARDKGWTDPVPFEYSELDGKEHRDWAGVAARYEWNDDYGEVGPPNVELESQLFRGDLIPRAGIKLNE